MEEQEVNNQVQQTTAKRVSISKKPEQLIIAAIIFVLLLVFGAIYVLNLPSRKPISPPPKPLASPQPISPTPTSIVIPTTDPSITANWKTYKSEEFGFEVRYPTTWEIQERKFKQTLFRFIPNAYATEPTNFYSVLLLVYEIDFVDPKNTEGYTYNDILVDGRGVQQSITVSVGKLEGISMAHEKVTDLVSYRIAMEKSFKEGRIVKDYTLDGKRALYSKRNTGTGNESTEYLAYNGYDEEVNVFLNNYFYSVYRNGPYYKNYFDQILSTFKFTDTDREDQVVCTQDVKECPDGSYVSRQGPNCEFAKCP